jgi:CBS domain-containing protein
MRRRHVGALVVVDEPEGSRVPLGIITDRDIVVEVLGNGLDPAQTTVDALLRKPVVIAHEGEEGSEVLERMRVHGVRRIPVVGSHQRLVGIITLDDVVKLIAVSTRAVVEIIEREQGHEHQSRR